MSLTGPAYGPGIGPPVGLVEKLYETARRVSAASASRGKRLSIDPLGLLTERAAVSGLRRRGRISCGGATRLLEARDGWFAVTFARHEDFELVPAWLEIGEVPLGVSSVRDATWELVESETRVRSVSELRQRAALLGLGFGALGDSGTSRYRRDPVRTVCFGDESPIRLGEVLVVDLSSLWAGPLCGRLLCDAGAVVVKVESSTRPDGTRRGPREFFDLMNAGKLSVSLSLSATTGVKQLADLIRSADVVIEASRPRALEQMGIVARDMLRCGPKVWISITGHGRDDAANRIAYGDDAAVSGGLVAWRDGAPYFCADAIGDPVSGLEAAAAALELLNSDGRWMVDVSMAGICGQLAGPTLDADMVEEFAPVVTSGRGMARPLGADNRRLARLSSRRRAC